MRKLLLFVALLSFAGVAIAQVAPPENSGINLLDPASWFASTAALAAFVATVIAFVRKHLLKTLDGGAVVVASISLGALLGLLGHAIGTLDGGVIAALIFGVTAGVSASGGIDLLRGITGGGGSDSGGTPPVTGTLPG